MKSQLLSAASRWKNVSHTRRCPVCEHDSWCQVGTGDYEGIVLCKRAKSAREKTNKDGVTYWVHRLGAPDVCGYVEREPAPRATVRADADKRHQVYTWLLDSLELSEAHRAALLARGLTESAIDNGCYATLPVKRIAVAQAWARQFDVSNVPGFVLKAGKKGGRFWSLAGPSGLLIPVRDAKRRIVAVKIRREGDEQPKYVSLSSSSAGGPKAENAVHWRLRPLAEKLVITEGELKADAVACLHDCSVLSIPGVGCWARAVEALREVPADQRQVVYVALDADWRLNPDVSRAMEALCAALLSEGHRVVRWSWPLALGKGIDDFLLRYRQMREAR
jgi:hypothetical protein